MNDVMHQLCLSVNCIQSVCVCFNSSLSTFRVLDIAVASHMHVFLVGLYLTLTTCTVWLPTPCGMLKVLKPRHNYYIALNHKLIVRLLIII